MYSIESLKSTQLRKLFIIFKSSNMPNFSIFGACKGFHFDWKIFFIGSGPPISGPVVFNSARQSSHLCRSPPTWPPCSDRAHGGERASTSHCRSSLLPMSGRSSFRAALLCSAHHRHHLCAIRSGQMECLDFVQLLHRAPARRH
jgi:hypothetical protein